MEKLRPACEVVVQYVLPAFRSIIAKTLIEEYNFSQVATAKELGITQASISQYLYSKRGEKIMKQLEKVPSVQSTAKEIARNIAAGKFTPIDAMQSFCRLCIDLRDNGVVCVLHKDLVTLPKVCAICGKMVSKPQSKSEKISNGDPIVG